jgi:hypothetical protein
MFKVRQGLTLKYSPKHPGLVSRSLQGFQLLNLEGGHWPTKHLSASPGIDIWKSQNSRCTMKMGCLDPSETSTWSTPYCSRQANQPCWSSWPWKQMEWRWGFLWAEGVKAAKDLKSLPMAIVHIDLVQHLVWSQSSLLRRKSKIMIFIKDNRIFWSILEYFLGLSNLVKDGVQYYSNNWSHSSTTSV